MDKTKTKKTKISLKKSNTKINMRGGAKISDISSFIKSIISRDNDLYTINNEPTKQDAFYIIKNILERYNSNKIMTFEQHCEKYFSEYHIIEYNRHPNLYKINN